MIICGVPRRRSQQWLLFEVAALGPLSAAVVAHGEHVAVRV
jgi:hypothetical protein